MLLILYLIPLKQPADADINISQKNSKHKGELLKAFLKNALSSNFIPDTLFALQVIFYRF